MRAHGVEHGLALEGLDAGERRALRRERAAAGGHDHDLGEERGADVGGEPEAAIAHALQGIDALAQMELRTERLDLRQQPVGQLLPGDDRQAGDVVDRLFRIKLGTLPAGLVEDVDDVRLDVEEAELEHRKQADRPGADDDGIRLDGSGAGPVHGACARCTFGWHGSGVPFRGGWGSDPLPRPRSVLQRFAQGV